MHYILEIVDHNTFVSVSENTVIGKKWEKRKKRKKKKKYGSEFICENFCITNEVINIIADDY